MDKLKQYVIFTVLGCLLVLVAGWFLLVSPKHGAASDLRSQAEGLVSSNAQLESKLDMLKSQSKNLPAQQAKLAAVAARIPDNPALPQLIRALTAAATKTGVELVTVSPGTAAAVVGAPSAAVTAPTTGTGTTGSVASSGATGSSAGVLTQIPVSLTVAGGFFQVQKFVGELENLPRAMRVASLNLVPGTNPVKPTVGTVDDGKMLSATITGQVFLASNRPPAVPVTVPGAAAPAAATVTAPVVPAKK